MREFSTHKDSKPRFYHLDNGNLLIVDDAGYHEYCKHCRRLLFEYLARNGGCTFDCGCPVFTVNDLVTNLLLSMDACQTIEEAKRMVLMLKAQKDMVYVR
jgi:hypothetical protein